MTLRNFWSNSSELLNAIPAELRETSDLNITDPPSAAKTLGFHWRVDSDTLHVATPHQIEWTHDTKRVVASAAAQIYDILGLWAPVTVMARILLYQIWRAKLELDEEAPEAITQQWTAWMQDLERLTQHPIPRELLRSNKTFCLQLHGFSDASTKAYGAVVYVRVVYRDSTVSSNIVIAKSRVAPVRPVTIPRLELPATVLLARLLATVASDHG